MMAKEYLEKLSELTKGTSLRGLKDIKIEVKHFLVEQHYMPMEKFAQH